MCISYKILKMLILMRQNCKWQGGKNESSGCNGNI